MPNRRAGRVNILVIAAVVCVILIAVVLLLGKQSPTEAGAKFMSALSSGNVDTLTDMTYLGDTPKDEIRKEWEFAAKQASPYYRFVWKISGYSQPNDHEAAVRLQVSRNADQPGTYDENFQLPLIKQDGKWKVDVRAINRDMYPALPR